MRDLFRVIIRAGFKTKRDYIDVEDVKVALVQELYDEFKRQLTDPRYYDLLKFTYENRELPEIEDKKILADLLNSRFIIEYGNGLFFEIHPVVPDILKERGEI